MLKSALDDAIFNVAKRQLIIVERTDYDIVRQHLLQKFDTYREPGQRRLVFTQANATLLYHSKNFIVNVKLKGINNIKDSAEEMEEVIEDDNKWDLRNEETVAENR